MKKIVLLASLTLIFANCGRSNDNTNEIIVDPIAEVPALPTKITGNSEVKEIKYNGNKISEISSAVSRMIFEYTGNFITKIIVYNIIHGEKMRSVDFVYNNGRLITAYPEDGNYKGVFSYSYPESNVINCTEITRYGSGNGSLISKKIVTYIQRNNNIISEELTYYQDDELRGSVSKIYTYDDKKNVYRNILGIDKIKAFLVSQIQDWNIRGDDNNNLTMDVVNPSINGEILKYKAINTINYSVDNYPVRIITKMYTEGKDNSQNYIGVNLFEYNK